MSVIFAKEKFTDIMGELPELFYLHWSENEENKEEIPLEINWGRYLALEQNGVLHIITARLENKIIGYFFAYVQPSIHHMNTLFAASDGFYILPEHRKGMAGVRLFKEAIAMSRDLGAKKLYVVVKAGSALGAILVRLKLNLSEETYALLL